MYREAFNSDYPKLGGSGLESPVCGNEKRQARTLWQIQQLTVHEKAKKCHRD